MLNKIYLLVFSVFRDLFFFGFFSVIFISCGSSENLIGRWESDREECSLKNEDIFRNNFEDNKYILEFVNKTQVELTYRQLEIEANVVEGEKSQGTNKLKCDIIFVGSYSYSGLSGNLEINFKNESGRYNSKKGEDCNTPLDIAAQMPKASPFLEKVSVGLEKVDAEILRLGFPGRSQCENDEIFVIFKRI